MNKGFQGKSALEAFFICQQIDCQALEKSSACCFEHRPEFLYLAPVSKINQNWTA
jgi:hypothetical protein